MSKILLLSGHDIDLLRKSDICLDVYDVYKNGIFFKVVKKNKFLLPFAFGDWKKRIKLYNTVVIFDTYYNVGMIDYIYKEKPNIKIIFYCWNTIETISRRIDVNPLFMDKRIEMWSYNRNDCKKYKMSYNPQFWNKRLIPMENGKAIDISFIGSPKHRINYLREISDYCDLNSLQTYFYVTNCKDDFNKNTMNKFLPYEEYIRKIASNSKAILDLVTEENYGLTLRPLEALFLKKKLITNYFDIVDEMFYNTNNVYLYGKDDRNINEFLDSPYKEIDENIIEFYNCESWIKRFEEN